MTKIIAFLFNIPEEEDGLPRQWQLPTIRPVRKDFGLTSQKDLKWKKWQKYEPNEMCRENTMVNHVKHNNNEYHNIEKKGLPTYLFFEDVVKCLIKCFWQIVVKRLPHKT